MEAFSIRGLGLLARSWQENPPFQGDAGFGAAIRSYRDNLLAMYGKEAEPKLTSDLAAWFRADRLVLESSQAAAKGVAVLHILKVLESDCDCVEDLGAVNRWPSRTGVPLEEYLTLWEKSCKEVGASGRLPARLSGLFGVPRGSAANYGFATAPCPAPTSCGAPSGKEKVEPSGPEMVTLIGFSLVCLLE